MITVDYKDKRPIYVQLVDNISTMALSGELKPFEQLPSVRQLADNISINMHTVNKAYSVLKQEGFVKLDRRKGAVVSLDVNKQRVLEEMKEEIAVAMAKGICKGIRREEVHRLVDEIYELFANWGENV